MSCGFQRDVKIHTMETARFGGTSKFAPRKGSSKIYLLLLQAVQ
jgi:hypothetical protein